MHWKRSNYFKGLLKSLVSNQILNTKIKKVKGKFSLVGSTKQE
jgi:hypothetical protein